MDLFTYYFKCCKRCRWIVILTEWDEFKNINWNEISQLTRKPTWIFDSRNMCDVEIAKSENLQVWKLGTS